MWPRPCPEPPAPRGPAKAAVALASVLALAACQGPPPTPVALGDPMPMGPFTLRAVSIDSYSRAHQGVPWEIEVRFTLEGGNRFERDDFANAVTHKGLTIRDAAGWSERGWLLWRNDERTLFAVQVNPPQEGHGYTARIANPYGKPAAYVVDLGR